MQIKKSKKASLEDKKLTYLLMGFVLVLSICFVALEWTEKEVTKYDVVDTDFLIEDEIEIEQTKQETPPPPPPPPAPEVIEELKVVDNQTEVEAIEIKTEDNNADTVVIAPPVVIEEEEEDESVIFDRAEEQPEFPGGNEKLFKYLSENVKYPVIAQENGIQGRVICQFVVNKDGSIVDVVVVRSGGDASLDKEAIRLMKSMPKWKPGMQRGKPVRVKFTVPVNFKLQ
ncbi:MAG: energy transducer TonB [Paludibacteraceae bacterium]